jgi:hypothetical protein
MQRLLESPRPINLAPSNRSGCDARVLTLGPSTLFQTGNRRQISRQEEILVHRPIQLTQTTTHVRSTKFGAEAGSDHGPDIGFQISSKFRLVATKRHCEC